MESLEAIRANIDDVDERLVQLIEQRAELVQSLMAVKKEQGYRRGFQRERRLWSARYISAMVIISLVRNFKPFTNRYLRLALGCS